MRLHISKLLVLVFVLVGFTACTKEITGPTVTVTKTDTLLVKPVINGWQVVVKVASGDMGSKPLVVSAARPNKFVQLGLDNIDVVSTTTVYDMKKADTVWVGFAVYSEMYTSNFPSSKVTWSFAGSMVGGDTSKIKMGAMESMYRLSAMDWWGNPVGMTYTGIHPISVDKSGSYLVSENVVNTNEMYFRQMLVLVWRPVVCGEPSAHKFESGGFFESQVEVVPNSSGVHLSMKYDVPGFSLTCNPAIEGSALVAPSIEAPMKLSAYMAKLRS